MVVSNEVRQVLPAGYSLHAYKIQKVIGRGSYGITYLAQDKYLNRKVAIKEYLPREYATREKNLKVRPTTEKQQEMFSWGLNNFLLEARTLAKFNHHGIIKVLSVIEENDTAYMIMEFEEGSDLAKIQSDSGHIPEQQLLKYFVPVLEGLAVVHKLGFIHRDIKPSNIYIRTDSSAVLLDFGSARQTVGNEADVLTTLVTAGFAPYEQYHQSKYDQGPWSDIYSLGATIYYCITGNKPADALLRGSSLLKHRPDPYIPLHKRANADYTENFLLAIDYALSFNIDSRPSDALQWSKLLSGNESAATLIEESSKNPQSSRAGYYPVTVPMSSTTLPPIQQVPPSNKTSEKTHAHATLLSKINHRVLSGLQLFRRKFSASPQSKGAQSSSDLNEKQDQKNDKRLAALSNFNKSIAKQFKKHPLTSNAILSVVVLIIPAMLIITNYVSEQKGSTVLEGTSLTSTPITGSKSTALANAAAPIIMQEKGMPENFTSTENEKTPLIAARTRTGILQVPVTNEPQTSIQTTLNSPSRISERKPAVLIKNVDKKPNQQLRVENARKVLISDLFTRADQAIALQRYSIPKDDNAIYYYRKILTLQPKHTKALKGMQEIEQRYADIVIAHIGNQKWKNAQKSIKKIRLIAIPNSTLANDLSESLKKEKLRITQTNHYLVLADELYTNNRLTRPKIENALNYYNKVLKLDPDNQKATLRKEKIFAKMSIVLRKQVTAKRAIHARRTYGVLRSMQPNSSIVSEYDSKVIAVEIEYKKILKLLQTAKIDFINNRISRPKDKNALGKYRSVLKIDKNNSQAKAGINRIITYYISNYYRQIDNNNFSTANKTLLTLKTIGYDKKRLATLKKFAKLEKQARIDTAVIQGLLSKLENGLNTRNIAILDNISVYKTKNRKYVSELMFDYSDYSVDITHKEHNKKTSRTTARIELSGLESAHDELFVAPDDISINIKIMKNRSKKWKVYW
ncbi:MAG: serine/threonine protein kinase [Thiohalomonadales bacterium]